MDACLKKIMLLMHRKMLADALIKELRDETGYQLTAEYNDGCFVQTAAILKPDIIVLEIPESCQPDLVKWEQIITGLKKEVPAAKILLLTPENIAPACALTLRMVNQHGADDFMYYDASLNYMIAKLKTL